jgi:hypothetical protein
MTDKAMMVKPARQPGNDECEVFAFSIVDLSVSLCDLIFFFFLQYRVLNSGPCSG